MSGQGARQPGQDPNSISDLWPWIIVILCALFGSRVSNLSMPEEVKRWVTPAVWVAVALVALYVYVKIRTKRRRRVMVRIAEGLAHPDLFGRSWDTGELTGRRWWRGRPRWVQADYPNAIDDRDPAWREQVVELIQHRMGVPAVKVKWDEKKGKVRVISRRPDQVVELTPEEVERDRAKTRVEAILAPLFGVDITVNIDGWRRLDESAAGDTDPAHVQVSYETMTRDTSPTWQVRVETILGLKLGGRWRGIYEPTKDRATFEPRPEIPARVDHPGPEAFTAGLRPVKPVLWYGVDADGNPVGWDLGLSSLPHTLCIGPTGGGKTTFLRSLVIGATCQGVWVYCADPKRIELTPFRGWPGVAAVASTAEDSAALVAAMDTEMERRYALIEAGHDASEFPKVLFIVDEFLILRSRLNRLWAQIKPKSGGGTKHPGLASITELLALARSAGIHLVIGVQRPDASLFGDEGARDNLRHRISLTRLSREGSTMAWGSPFVGVDLPMIPGRAMASPSGDSPVEVQTFWLSDPRRASGSDARLMKSLRELAGEAMKDVAQPVDLSDLSAQALRYMLADEPKVITELTDVPVAASGLVTTPDRSSTASTDAEGGLSGEFDVQTVTAETVMPGDKVLLASGEVGLVVDVDVADYDEDEVVIDVDSPSGGEHLAMPRDGSLSRVIDLGDDIEDHPKKPAADEDEYEYDFD